MEKVLKVGVIGCGQIAQMVHLNYLHEMDRFEIYSLCDISKSVVDKVGVKYGVAQEHRYTDMDDMLKDPVLDAVVICTRDHYEAGVKAAKAKKHLLVEKPLAQNLSQADEIIKIAKENNLVLLVGYMKRYDPAYEYALEKIKALKDIEYVRVHDFAGSFDFTEDIFDLYSGTDLPKEVLDEGMKAIHSARIAQIGKEKESLSLAYGTLLGLTSHDTILLRHAFGKGKVKYAHARSNGFVTAVLEYDNFCCTIESGLITERRNWDENFHVYSHTANISVHFPWPYLKNSPTIIKINENEPNSMTNVNKEIVGGYDEAYKREWIHFYNCIVNGEKPISSGEDARQDIELADEIIKMATIN